MAGDRDKVSQLANGLNTERTTRVYCTKKKKKKIEVNKAFRTSASFL